jgi:uncharacterized surface protein with fasciclin (FAS1) repeats
MKKYNLAVVTLIGLMALHVPAANANNTNVEAALASQPDLSTFYQALLNTGVASELKEDGSYTVFAPTNAAFAEIQPGVYPCFYAIQCRPNLAAVIRNHIVPINDSVNRFSKWGYGIPTIGSNRILVEEPFKGQYTVARRTVLDQTAGNADERLQADDVSLYRIDGVILSQPQLDAFRSVPVVMVPSTVTKKTVTTYQTTGTPTYQANSGPTVVTHTYAAPGYAAPGGYPSTTTTYVVPSDASDDADDVEATTVTHTTISQ